MRALLIALCVATLAPDALTQEAAAPQTLPSVPKEPSWAFDVSLSQYFIPDGRDYLQPTVTADRGPLHLEARYNYEALDTASLWAGYNMAFGDELSLELTPMLGAAFGDLYGPTIGYLGTLGWRRLELYSAGEYLFDLEDHDDSYLYSWTQLTVSALEHVQLGLVSQRTRAYESDIDIQRGLLLGLDFEPASLTLNVFNLDRSDPIWIVSLSAGW